MAAKPKSKRRSQAAPPARRLRTWVYAACLFGAMGWGGVWGLQRLTDPAVLPLRVVHIEGELRRLSSQSLERAVAGHASGSFFSVDVAKVAEAAAALAWVDQVRVRRVWPDALRIWVREQVPLALWGEQGLVNARGEVFTPEDGRRPAELAQLFGPDESALQLSSEYLSMRERLRGLGLEISKLHLTARGAWTLELANGPVVNLGSNDLQVRLARFIRIYPRLTASDAGHTKNVDMRYTNGLAVRWAPQIPPPESAPAGTKAATVNNDRGTLQAVDGRSA